MRSRPRCRRTVLGAVLAIAWLAAAGCTGLKNTSRRDSVPVAPSAPSDAAGPSAALLAQSRAQRAAGNNSQARALIERALAIDPNNAALWVELGEIELATGQVAEAATMARKALTLAPRDSSAAAAAGNLLERARR